MEMQIERRRRKMPPLSHHVCGCYRDISGLEEQLETVSTATEQPDTPALTTKWFLESCSSLADTGAQQRKYYRYNYTNPEATTIPRVEGIQSPPLSVLLCPGLFCVCATNTTTVKTDSHCRWTIKISSIKVFKTGKKNYIFSLYQHNLKATMQIKNGCAMKIHRRLQIIIHLTFFMAQWENTWWEYD